MFLKRPFYLGFSMHGSSSLYMLHEEMELCLEFGLFFLNTSFEEYDQSNLLLGTYSLSSKIFYIINFILL